MRRLHFGHYLMLGLARWLINRAKWLEDKVPNHAIKSVALNAPYREMAIVHAAPAQLQGMEFLAGQPTPGDIIGHHIADLNGHNIDLHGGIGGHFSVEQVKSLTSMPEEEFDFDRTLVSTMAEEKKAAEAISKRLIISREPYEAATKLIAKALANGIETNIHISDSDVGLKCEEFKVFKLDFAKQCKAKNISVYVGETIVSVKSGDARAYIKKLTKA